MPLSDRVKALRLEAGLTQHELATRAGLQTVHVSRLERGATTDPRWSAVCAIADALGVDVGLLRDQQALPKKE